MAQVPLYLSLYALFPRELPGFFKPENAQCLPSEISVWIKSSRKTGCGILCSQGKDVLLAVTQFLPKTKELLELQCQLIPEVEITEITTLKELNTKHLFKMKALKNLQLCSGEHLNRGGSGAFTFSSFTKAVVHLLSTHCSLLLSTERIEAGIPTHPKYSWFLRSHAKRLSPD